ncbi:MAG: TonB family protein [Terriglobales bacterium]
MGYQALLFCADEKLARVASQLFSELEFAVTTVNDPFAAVKNVMAQHYDAIVVDCENEQNAALLFKSARSSSFNQGSLAIGLVEGQAGVAKAYRMGSNLVLTKPINIEQAKGTLRVARGLLRKGAEAAASHITSAAKPAASAHPIELTNQSVGANSEHGAQNAPRYGSPAYGSPEGGGPTTAAPAFASSVGTAIHVPAVQATSWTSIAGQMPAGQTPAARPPATPTPTVSAPGPAKPRASEQSPAAVTSPKPSIAPVVNTATANTTNAIMAGSNAAGAGATRSASTASGGLGAAAAPARAREIEMPAQPAYEDEEDFLEVDSLSVPAAHSNGGAAISQGPSFSTIAENTGGSGGKKVLIGAVAIFLVIAAYFGWTKFGQSNSAPVLAPTSAAVAPAPLTTPDAAPNPHSTPAAAQPSGIVVAHISAPSNAAPRTTSSSLPQGGSAQSGPPQTGSSQAGFAQTASAQTGHSPAETAAAPQSTTSFESQNAKSSPAAILVKPGSAAGSQRSQTQNQVEEASVQPPSPLGVASPSVNTLNGVLVATAAKPELARVRVSQGVSQGLLIKTVQPRYPANALSSHTQGAVQIEATIDKDGRVVSPKVLSGSPLLAQAALDAVRQWRYKPYYLDGEPVAIQTQITINFKQD